MKIALEYRNGINLLLDVVHLLVPLAGNLLVHLLVCLAGNLLVRLASNMSFSFSVTHLNLLDLFLHRGWAFNYKPFGV